MSDNRKPIFVDSSSPLTAQDDMAKTNALIAYGFMAIGFFTGIFWLVGVIWALLKRGEARGSIFEDHFTNIIKIFFWGLVFSLIGFVLSFVIIGYVILLLVWLWAIFKTVKGLARLTSNKAYAGV